MFNSSLVEILKSLSANEINDFEGYIRSSYFNRNRNVTGLFSYMKKFHPSYTSKNLLKENVFMKVFNTNKYNKGLMATTMFHLSGHLENWMAYRNFAENGYKRNESLLLEYEKRNLSKFYEKVYLKMSNEMSGRKINSEFINEKLWIDAFYSNFISNRTMEGLKGLDAVYKEMGELLLVNFLIWARNIIQNFKSRERFYRMKTDFNILGGFFESLDAESFLQKIQRVPGKTGRVVEFIMYQILCVIDTESEHYYDKCSQMLDKVLPMLDKDELYTAHSNLLYSATLKENKNYKKYSAEYLRLLKSMVESGSYIGYGPHISVSTYDAVINTALNNKEILWTEKNVIPLIKELPADIQENITYYSLARIAAEKGSFDEALRFYNKINIDGFMLKIRLRTFLVKLYYDTGQYETVLSHIDTFRHFISNKENISQSGRELYTVFLKILSMLVGYRLKKKPYIIDKIRQSLKETENIINKKWLYEKLTEIEI